MYCSKCGKQIEDNAVFCPFCGQKVTIEENTTSYSYSDSQSDNGSYNSYNANSYTGEYSYNQTHRDTQGEFQNAYRSDFIAPAAQTEPWQVITYIGCVLLFVSLFLPFKSVSTTILTRYYNADFNIFAFSRLSFFYILTLPLLAYFAATRRPFVHMLILCCLNVIIFAIPAFSSGSSGLGIVVQYNFGFFLGLLALIMTIAGPVIYMLQTKKLDNRNQVKI